AMRARRVKSAVDTEPRRACLRGHSEALPGPKRAARAADAAACEVNGFLLRQALAEPPSLPLSREDSMAHATERLKLSAIQKHRPDDRDQRRALHAPMPNPRGHWSRADHCAARATERGASADPRPRV